MQAAESFSSLLQEAPAARAAGRAFLLR